MSQIDAENQAQSIPRTEEHSDRSEDHENSSLGAASPGGQLRSLNQRVVRAFGQGSIIGGIIARMISDKQERIREVDDCLEWYQREREKRLIELAELEALLPQIEADAQS
jgi:hypothetical protein